MPAPPDLRPDPDAVPVRLPPGASLAELQRYIVELEALKGWSEVDLVRCCFLMGEEVGELFGAVRRLQRTAEPRGSVESVAEELVDVLNYTLAIANRAGVDLEAAFRAKNAQTQLRTWPAGD